MVQRDQRAHAPGQWHWFCPIRRRLRPGKQGAETRSARREGAKAVFRKPVDGDCARLTAPLLPSTPAARGRRLYAALAVLPRPSTTPCARSSASLYDNCQVVRLKNTDNPALRPQPSQPFANNSNRAGTTSVRLRPELFAQNAPIPSQLGQKHPSQSHCLQRPTPSPAYVEPFWLSFFYGPMGSII
jgi:hypothetical protein